MRNIFAILTILVVLAARAGLAISAESASSAEEIAVNRLLDEATVLLKQKKPGEAVDKYLNTAIQAFDEKYKNGSKRVYCARTQEESLMYLLQSVADKSDGAVVVNQIWCEANYLKAYALLDMGAIQDARRYISKAIELSPQNSIYLSEQGQLQRMTREWHSALVSYQAAKDAAQSFSPSETKAIELSRAMRGIGFVYIELRRYHEAEAVFKNCLQLNPNDATAKAELNYLSKLRAKENANQ